MTNVGQVQRSGQQIHHVDMVTHARPWTAMMNLCCAMELRGNDYSVNWIQLESTLYTFHLFHIWHSHTMWFI
jgi:hypothetical protein